MGWLSMCIQAKMDPAELQPHLNVALKDSGKGKSSWWSELQVVVIHLCG